MASNASMDDSDLLIQTNAENLVRNIIHGKYEIQHSGVFKWKYALCNRSDTKNKFTSISDDAFAVGDWNISPRVESAFISGNALGGYLLEQRL
jgi:predicted NAD/FAD-dependent oxidoreductase